jgi:hypothetical protein
MGGEARRGAPPARACLWLLGAALLLAAAPAEARVCRGGRSSGTAIWYSVAHPGLGEWYLRGWGPFSRVPPRKFWLGFIPGFGWPGYLQYKSARDVSRCRVNDELF